MKEKKEKSMLESIIINGEDNILNLSIKKALEENIKNNCIITANLENKNEIKSIDRCIFMIDCTDISFSELNNKLQYLEIHKVKIVIIINYTNQNMVLHNMNRKIIRGCFSKVPEPYYLLKGIHTIISGGTWFPREILEKYLEKQRVSNKDWPEYNIDQKLTRREIEILKLVKTGASNTRIADELCLSQHTIKTHMHNLFRKLNVSNRVQAANSISFT
ncbi:response regulator transcription factor [Oceanospirillum sediminis]|uniref:Response regulator transcription factor n=1 Tax=Oceanospirillum sediminis TaxID=2760088 RepID=A0A839IN84_9GAMM|nr:response regulator transcription factor [Oceanospirillum sediminis]MBB1486154.1 response regulator transcription factor [Oceanospirillum sediminis]